MARRIAGYLVLGILILGGIVWLLQQRDPFSDADFNAAREVLEEVRGSFDDTTCQRAAILGENQDAPLPLDEVLSLTGPFAECWTAAAHEHVAPLLSGGSFDAAAFGTSGTELNSIEPGHSLYDNAPEPLRTISRACADLEPELERQARSPNRCWPIRPSSDEWHEGIEAQREVSFDVFTTAVSVLARQTASGGDVDAGLRTTVRGIATLRDVSLGSRIDLAKDAALAEARLAATFQTILQERTPTPEGAETLDEALSILEDTAVDPSTAMLLENVALFDVYQRRPDFDAEGRHYWSYTMAKMIPRMQEACPSGADAATCQENFPLERTVEPTLASLILGPPAVMPYSLEFFQAAATTTRAEELSQIVRAQKDGALLRTLLTWAMARSAGECPSPSSGSWSDDPDAPFVASSRRRFQLIGPSVLGASRTALYFTCRPEPAPQP